MNRQRFLLCAATAALLALGTSTGARAEPWPAKPITMIIPFPPGGTLDVVGRLLAQKLGQQLGQTVIVDNRAGGAGTIGASAVARAPGDGYTLLFSASTFTTTPMTQKTAAYDVVKDFAPVALVAKAPLAIAVNKNLPFNDVKGLLTYARAHPGKLTFAIGSTGSAGHLSTEMLRRAGQMEYLIVPYKGSAPAYQDLIGGSVDAFIDPILGSASFAKAGQLKVLAVTSKNRVPSQPELPTVGETVPGYEFYSWYGLWGPASLPKEIAVRLNAEVNKALGTDMREQLTPQGLLLTPGSIDDFVRFQKDDMALSQRIVTEGKIRAE
ncbi:MULTISPECIES: tripartite tricarboxylate transporter substrate binding protein [unclassified Rhizobacter]|uniref:Bug family tripartite tricarboxylate transporter substrate binding protein n=1 Tax=unclassified Rhizobacter TaxID=2640088 RepID=UPI0006FB344B|nr:MULTISPECIES: tripartite tricarboxylate transporter substrate binding protein [unclassified Rhizobacter]KQU81105.1 twin-arginine translocation pathway signal [Rhizobacter sp. Root29]KQW04649.1 twin-arginine translocation pathway signal [Rhizobacter sp. Root1238]KRB06488.1 twin-arginine translocation pathway signal [Rhizobacter sp. Root16D2]